MSNTQANTPDLKGIIFLAIPMIVFLLLITMNFLAQNSGSSWHIKITGYDPRDILQGHYIIYRYDWNTADTEEEQCSDYGKLTSCCLCLNESETGNINPKVERFDCSQNWEAKSCQAVIKSKQRYGRTTYPSNKYYIDQNYALDVEHLMRNRDSERTYYIDLSVSDQGQAVIRDMYVDGVPLKQFLLSSEGQEAIGRDKSR